LQPLLNEFLKKEFPIIQNRIINDTIYNHIEYTKLESEILQTKILNRLQFITQNALAYFSFPSITTKRYIHSVGTMHVSSFMFKNALLNASSNTQNQFLKELKYVVDAIIKDENLNITLKGNSYFYDKALYQFMIPTKSNTQANTYRIILQTVRIAGLLHDVGHSPFSHQTEYALKNVYNKLLKKNEALNQKEEDFVVFYEEMTQDGTLVLHEALGIKLIDMLFKYEMKQLCDDQDEEQEDYLKLIHKLVVYTIEERTYNNFNFKVLHKLIDGTVDADRLDYINRDMVASGYIGGPNDYLRITKQTILTKKNKKYKIGFYDMALIDIEHMLEMRFNLYKKVIYNFNISKKDALLENVIFYLCKKYFNNDKIQNTIFNNISMLWKFLDEKDYEKKLDNISLFDENWLISLFKSEYFHIKNKEVLSFEDQKYLYAFEEVLFGKKFFKSIWKNLNELYNILDFTLVERYKFRESFGFITKTNLKKLQGALDGFILKHEKNSIDTFIAYQVVSFKLGIEKDFTLFDGEKIIHIDEVSTLRKRLKQSMSNTVPFFLYINKEQMTEVMKKDLKDILLDTFTY